MFLPLVALAGSLYLLTREQEAPLGAPAVVPPELIQRIAVTRPLEGGGSARYFKPEIASQVSEALAAYALERVDTQDLPPGAAATGLVFRIIPLTPGAPLGTEQTAQQAVLAAQEAGAIVLATLSTVLLHSPGTKLLMMCRQAERRLASQGSQWAILSEAVGAPKVEEAPAPMAGSVQFDAHLPLDIRSDLARLYGNPDSSPADFVAAAKALEKLDGADGETDFPLTVKSLRDKATAMALRDQVRRAANIPVVEPPTQVVGDPDPPFHPDQAVSQAGVVEQSHPAQVIGSVMGDRKPRGDKAKDKGAPPNGAAQA